MKNSVHVLHFIVCCEPTLAALISSCHQKSRQVSKQTALCAHAVLDGAEVTAYQISQSIPMGRRKMKEADKSRDRKRERDRLHKVIPTQASIKLHEANAAQSSWSES